jgi:Zn-dependent protease
MVGLTAYFGRDDRPLERAAVALAGPAASAALVLALVGVRASMTSASTATAVVELALLLNVVGLVGNLLPVGGTDGAHLIRGVSEHRRASRPTR